MKNHRAHSLYFLLLVIVGAGIALTIHTLFLPSPGDRFLASRHRAIEVLNTPAPERFLPVAPEQEKPLLVRDRDVAELLIMKVMLRTIMWSEGTYPRADGLSPYRVIYGGNTFDGPYDKHPDICVEVASGKITPQACNGVLGTTAAGACQFITPTWTEKVEKYRKELFTKNPVTGEPVGEFDPLNQELLCLLLFADTGAYDPLMQATSVTPEGKLALDKVLFAQAIHLAAVEWASFPLENGLSIGDSSGQRAHTVDEIFGEFLKLLEAEEAQLQQIQSPKPTVQTSAQTSAPGQDSVQQVISALLMPLKVGEAVEKYAVTSPYGMRMHPTLHVMRLHNGVDIGTPYGTPLLAPIAGKNSCHNDPPWGIYAWFEPDDLPGKAFMVHHTSVCEDGHYNPGEVFAKSGTTSGTAGTGDHAHFGTWRVVGGAPESYDPPRGWVEAFLKGKIPDAAIEGA